MAYTRQHKVQMRIVVDSKRNTDKASQAAMDRRYATAWHCAPTRRFHIHRDKRR